jgi:hypothetical protein
VTDKIFSSAGKETSVGTERASCCKSFCLWGVFYKLTMLLFHWLCITL